MVMSSRSEGQPWHRQAAFSVSGIQVPHGTRPWRTFKASFRQPRRRPRSLFPGERRTSDRQHRRRRLSFALRHGRNFGLTFFLLNLPFFYLSLKRLGPAFTLKTFIAIALTSFLTDMQALFSRSGRFTRAGPLSSAVYSSDTVSWRSTAPREPRRRGHIGHLPAERFGIRAVSAPSRST